VAAGRALTELRSVGPFTASFLARWIREKPDPPKPPPLRDGFLTYAYAREVVAAHPDWATVARADHQMHTDETDGSSTIEEMAEAAAALGRDRIAITDHSKTLRITNGMDEPRLRAQGEHIARLNARGAPPLVLRAIEMDLTPTGEGDMDPVALGELDLVLGAFHSKLRLRDDQTERYLQGVANPDIHVLAHPRGRIYNFRAGLSCEWERVARRAAELGTALEIDAYPDRQDLDVERLRIVAAEGAWVSIGTDAHTPDELVFLEIGIAAAILAGVRRERILNLLSPAALAEHVGLVRATKARVAERSPTMPVKRERVDTTPGRPGGSRYVRRDRAGQFTGDQTSVGRSVAQDRRVKAKTRAPKGMKDRGD
jgi:histidinol phosphatase-like PHP family hydrolase